MWCPNCKTEYGEEVSACPDCGSELVTSCPGERAMASWAVSRQKSITKFWPKGDDGKPETAAYLTHRTSVNYEDVMLINMLDAYGIPAIKYYPSNGTLGKVILGMSGAGADIYVPVSMLEDAKALMEDNQND